MLNFKDKSIKQYVAESNWYMVVIKQDFRNPWYWVFDIYQDTIEALWGIHLQSKVKIPTLIEAKRRATMSFDNIIKTKYAIR